MTDIDLFEAETAALARAYKALATNGLPADGYRPALEDLIKHYERLMRETRRLIARSDRTERELNSANTTLQQLSRELDYKARHDNLTGALNRGAVFERAARYLEQGSLSLIVLDIDFFKRINDAFGHPAGDAVIRELVARLTTTLEMAGHGDVGRVGGEEFTVLLPRMDIAEAMRLAETVRRAIADKIFLCLPEHQVTASFGVSWSEQGGDFETAYGHADAALYQAKHAGRNRVEQACSVTPIGELQQHLQN
ncbi:GGDEF domain-containing protein [Oxalobacteraceae bacterium CAVE-383]|nr:GGDEF domain-containing protein [Oxalobacteraceae bacterium CAVE-383]